MSNEIQRILEEELEIKLKKTRLYLKYSRAVDNWFRCLENKNRRKAKYWRKVLTKSPFWIEIPMYEQ